MNLNPLKEIKLYMALASLDPQKIPYFMHDQCRLLTQCDSVLYFYKCQHNEPVNIYRLGGGGGGREGGGGGGVGGGGGGSGGFLLRHRSIHLIPHLIF